MNHHRERETGCRQDWSGTAVVPARNREPVPHLVPEPVRGMPAQDKRSRLMKSVSHFTQIFGLENAFFVNFDLEDEPLAFLNGNVVELGRDQNRQYVDA